MNEISTNIKTAPNNRLRQWLFNPFRVVAGYKALLLGLAFILVSSFVGYLGNTHFDGLLDVHTGREAPLWFFFAEALINWLSLAIPLFFFGLIVSRSSFRVVDVFGTQALARWPQLITALVMLPDANRRFAAYIMFKFVRGAPTATGNCADMVIFAFALLVAIAMTIWMVTLMYRGYAVSCNIKGGKAISTFIVSLMGAEVLSKFAILLLYRA
jgi:hypothetical protein